MASIGSNEAQHEQAQGHAVVRWRGFGRLPMNALHFTGRGPNSPLLHVSLLYLMPKPTMWMLRSAATTLSSRLPVVGPFTLNVANCGGE